MKEIICSGALFYSLNTNKFLFLHRAKGKQKELWGLVGGTNEDNESPYNALLREISEEIGTVDIKKSIPLELFVSNDSHFSFHTYLCFIENEFIPTLNDEHDGYAWVSFGKWPKPLHSGLRNTLQKSINQNKLETVLKLIKIK